MKKNSNITQGGATKLTAADRQQIKKDPAKVLSKIIVQQSSLYSKAMSDWLAARAAAENPVYPIRTLLYDLYHDLILDGFFYGLFYNHRVLPIKNKAFKIVNASGEEQPEKTKLLQKDWFYKLMLWYMESKLYGYSLPYIDSLSFDGSISNIQNMVLLPRKHVHPEKHVVTPFQNEFDGIDYQQRPLSNYVFPIGDPFDLGLLNIAAPLLIIKKHSWQSWDQFEEMFGIPIRIAKTASQDPRVQNEIQNWLVNMGSASYGIFPEGTDIDIRENKQTDAFSVFQQKITSINEELAILACGQTMTSMNGSSRSQGEVHERVKDQITKDDERGFRTLVNEHWLKMLMEEHGYPLEAGDSFEWDQPEDLDSLLKIYQGIDAMGFQLDQQQVAQKFGVKILGLKTGNDVEQQEEDSATQTNTKAEEPLENIDY
jgi:phage gp29-like protein